MQSAAGFSAGSIPTIGIYGYISRSFRTAALVAVLQATTRPFAPWSNSFRAHPIVSSRTFSFSFVPYGAFLESPK